MARHVLANFLTFLIIVMVMVGGFVFWGKSEFSKAGPLSDDTVITIKQGDRLQAVADRLAGNGVVSNATIFRIGARYAGQETRLKYGEYAVPASASMQEVLNLITSGRGISYQVTIPEGWTVDDVINRLNENTLLTGTITTVPAEGSLAPNTYSVSKGDSRDSVLLRMQNAQKGILAVNWSNRQADLPLKTPEEMLILASIIEKETGISSEREEVAAVFINRLRRGMKLQTDPTVIYGITGGVGKLGRGLRRSELLKKTPYNTYIIPALPPTPIANPGEAAIKAAGNPATSEYLFFVADGTGGHAFAVTLAEHNRNVAKWRKIEAQRRRDAQSAEQN